MKKVLLLLSGGFDSAVACKLLQEKKFQVIGLHLSNSQFSGNESIQKTQKLAELLKIELFTEDISNELSKIASVCDHKYYFVLMKRFFLQKASTLAKKENCFAIATGESLAQVSSQTLENLKVIDQATDFQVLRPLIALNKETIINLAKKFQTHDISIGKEYCDVLGPKHPSTKARLEVILKEESKLKSNENQTQPIILSKGHCDNRKT